MLIWTLSFVFILSMVSLTLAQTATTPAAPAAAPTAAPAGPPQIVKDMVAKTKAGIKTVKAEDAKAAIDKKEKAVFLDVRDAGEFSAGHLPGAINVSRGTLEFNIWGKVPDQSAKIYVYCKTAGRSTFATKTLNDLGYKNAVLVDVQFEDWIKAGYPVER